MSSKDFNLTSSSLGTTNPPINFNLGDAATEIEVPSFEVTSSISVGSVIADFSVEPEEFSTTTELSVDKIVADISISSVEFDVGVEFPVPEVNTLEDIEVESSSFDISSVFSVSGGYVEEHWYDGNFKRRIKITIDKDKVQEDVEDFPVYLDLSLFSDSFWDYVKEDGADIRITKGDKVTECAQDVVSCDTALKTGEMYFLAPNLSSSEDTYFYLYFDNPDAFGYVYFSTYGADACWKDYLLVSHDGMLSRANHVDNTVFVANDNPSAVTGKIGDSGDFPSDPRPYIRMYDTLEEFGFSELTFSCFAKTDDGDTANQVLFTLYGNSDDSFYYWLDDNSNGIRTWREWNGSSAYRTTTNWVPSDNTWFYTSWTADGVDWKSFINGGEEGSSTESMRPTDVEDSTPTFYIGGRAGDDRHWQGSLDEIRIRYDAISLNWHKTEYDNLTSPSTFTYFSEAEYNHFVQTDEFYVYADLMDWDLGETVEIFAPINIEIPEFSINISIDTGEVGFIESVFSESFDINNSIEVGGLRISAKLLLEERYALPIISRNFVFEDSLRLVVNSEFEEEYLLSETANVEFEVESSLRVSSEHEEQFQLSYQTNNETEAEYSLRPKVSTEVQDSYYIANTVRLVFIDEHDISSLNPISKEFSIIDSLIKGTSSFYSITVSAEV